MANRIPDNVPELIEWLDEQFPEKCVKLGDNFEEALHYSGQRSIVILLKSRMAAQHRRDAKENAKLYQR